MKSVIPSMALPLVLGLIAAILRAADHVYYRDSGPVLRLLRLAPSDGTGQKGYHRTLDPIFAWFPFSWIWCDIFALLGLGRLAPTLLVWVPVSVFAAGRFRALQEAAHTAVHSGLSRSRRYQWSIANAAVQWPLFRPDMHYRHIGHVEQHHRHANQLTADPNVARLISIGVRPGMTSAVWRRRLWYPMTLTGLLETVVNVARGTRQNVNGALLPLRLAVAGGVLALVGEIAGPLGLLLGFIVPLLTLYPLFSWISLLAEHRWFVRCDATTRRLRECTNGRPTDYPGPGGWIIKHLVFPFSDHYHLAHSLYPFLRWNHLKAVDAALKARSEDYSRHRSVGLFLATGGTPAALSELRGRLTDPDPREVANWAMPSDTYVAALSA